MKDTMKAWGYERYGHPEDVLELRDVDVPTIEDDQVLVRVHAASVNPVDWHLMTGEPRFLRLVNGLRRPRRSRPGADVAGTVEAVGENVTRFEPGDEVFGQGLGTLAEYAAVSEQGLVAKPGRLTMEQAAAVPVAGLTALQGLRDWGDMEQGDRVLVNGASGGVGTFAVQIARALGAEVTAVCSSRNVAQAEEIGATRVVDYTREDFTELAERFDVFFDGPGNRPLSECSRMLEPDGTYVMIGGPKGVWVSPMPRLVAMKLRSLLTGMNTGNGTARRVLGDLMILRDLLESGQINPVIDRNYKLEEAIDALTYQGTFHAMGKIVVTV